MTFPGAGATVYYNEAGEPTGWDYESDDAPDLDAFYEREEYEREDEHEHKCPDCKIKYDCDCDQELRPILRCLDCCEG